MGLIVTLIVVGFGTVEDWFGRTYYADDAIGYFDVSKAIDRGDCATALNPYWSIGYPTILSATRWMFPPGPYGEWTALHVVNLVIFLAIYLSFLYFLKAATIYTAKVNGDDDATAGNGWNGFIFVIGTSVFLLWQLMIGNASRLSPDPLVSGIFFLVTAAALHFYMRPSAKTAVVMGLLMGFGYLVKAVFLPISVGMLLVVFLHCLTRSRSDRRPAITKLAWAIPVIAFVTLPYIIALSHAVGKFTLGESGSLNYAWNVNHLPHSCNWQGGTAQFGVPFHPTHLVLRDPPVFTFAEPFHVTYPPWYNPPYWYEGYHHFFNIKNEISALKATVPALRRFFFEGRHCGIKALGAGLLLALCLFLLKERRTWWKRLMSLWPLYLLPIAAFSVYLLVVIEPRYVVGFLIVLLLTPFLPLVVPTPLFSKRVGYAFVILFATGCAAILVGNKKDAIHRAIHNEPYTSDEQWRIGSYLIQSGVQPEEKVAAVAVWENIECTWAYVSGVHIVAEIGNDAFDFDHHEQDFHLFLSSPDVQQTVFTLFRQAGAKLVVASYVDGTPQGPGWEQIPGTRSWIHRLDENAP